MTMSGYGEQDWATPAVSRLMTMSGLRFVADAFPFGAFERWEGTRRYYVYSSRRAQLESVYDLVDVDVLEAGLGGVRCTVSLCRGVSLMDAIQAFLTHITATCEEPSACEAV